MDLTIHLYGYSYYMFNTLNAIAMFRNSAFYPAAINAIALMVTAYYAIMMANSGNEWRSYLLKVVGVVVLINALLLPKTTMYVKDHVEKRFWKVDNIPVAFALPVGMLENLGHVLTIGFEQAFSVVDGKSAFSYYHYGTAFGARLAKEVMQVHVRDPEYISNMRGFIRRCVILPAGLGEQFTKEELVSTKNMWKLVSENAGTFTRTPMTIGGVRQVPSPTCKQAVPYFEGKMGSSIKGDITGISIRMRAPGKDAKYNPSHSNMNEALKSQIAAIYKDDSSVENILKHNMMINALNQHRAATYPAVKAKMQQEASGLLSGFMADHVLVGMLTVCKNLIYGSFIFVFPLMLLAGGMSKYRGWITVCMALQLWPALFAMLNMIIDLAYEPTQIVSYSAWSTELKRMDSIASIAANLKLLIPPLSFYITRMGEGGFLNIAGSVIAASQSAVAASASEQTIGGRNYDNSSIGNVNKSNVNENKYDTSRQYIYGTNSTINPDGTMQKVLPNGNVITTGGAGASSSVGEASYRESSGITGALHEGIRNEQQLMQQEMAALNKAEEKLIKEEASALSQIAENARTDQGYNIDTSTDEGKEVAKALNKIDRMTEGNDYTWEQNARAYLKAEASSDKSLFGKIASYVGISATLGGEVSAGNGSSQNVGKSSDIVDETTTNDRQSINERSSKNSNFSKGYNVDKNLQKSIGESYNSTKRLEESISEHKDNIKAHSKGLDYSSSHGNEYSKDMTQEVVDAYRNRYNVSDYEAAKAVLGGSKEAQKIFYEINQGKVNDILEKVRVEGRDIANSDNVSSFVDKHKEDIDKNLGGEGSNLGKFMKENNIKSEEEVKQIVSDAETKNKERHETSVFKITTNYDDTAEFTDFERIKRAIELGELEENRIGKGKIGRFIGGAANFVSFGNAGWGIGRPQNAGNEQNVVTPKAFKPKGSDEPTKPTQYVNPDLINKKN